METEIKENNLQQEEPTPLEAETTGPITELDTQEPDLELKTENSESIFTPQTAETRLKTDPSPALSKKVEVHDPAEEIISEVEPPVVEEPKIDEEEEVQPETVPIEQEPEPEVPMEHVSARDFENEARVRIKLDNIIGGTIPHLEAIISITLPKDKYKVIYDKLFEMLAHLSKLLAVVQIFCQKEIDWSTKDQGLVTHISDELNVPEEHVRRGPNFYTIGFMIDLVEEAMFNPAFRTWPKLATKGEKIALYKCKMSFWRKIEVFCSALGKSVVADKTQIQFQKEGTGKWKKLNEIATFVTAMTEKEMQKKFDEINHFIYLTSAAHGKTAKVLLNIRKMSKKELEFHMSHKFEDYEREVMNASREGYKQIWRKNNTPKLSSKLWKNVFQYMINQDEAMRDLDLFIAFCNKDCIKVSPSQYLNPFLIQNRNYGTIVRPMQLKQLDHSEMRTSNSGKWCI